jgi:hypothetical protein
MFNNLVLKQININNFNESKKEFFLEIEGHKAIEI